MIITKFDLYKSEWLELVFDDRNKEYGAYDLRKHYAGNLAKAMAIAFFSVGLLFFSYGILFKHKPLDIIKVTPVNIDPRIVVLPQKVEPKQTETIKQSSVSTIKNPVMVVAPDPIASKPVTLDEIKGKVIGTETVQGKDDGSFVIPEGPKGTGDGPPKIDNTPFDANTIDVMPEPYGGAAAWSKFLQKNIHYPSMASEEGKQGKVWLSFIIERDGHLSNIVVEKGVGFGLDEEALRVLKLAPAWKPGKQNNQAVRVKYTIPISFQISDPDN